MKVKKEKTKQADVALVLKKIANNPTATKAARESARKQLKKLIGE